MTAPARTITVESETRPGIRHTLVRTADGALSCSCEHWTFKAGPAGELCKHLAEAVERKAFDDKPNIEPRTPAISGRDGRQRAAGVQRTLAMGLRGKKPTAKAKRLKTLFFGPAGVGKTTAAIQFPNPYLIDTEKGAENEQYVRLIREAGGAVFFTTDADELIAELTTLLSDKHEYKTVIIDPLTVIYNDLLDKAADKVGTDFGKHKGPADRKIKHMLNLLLRLDMNVVITSHAKPNWVRAKDAGGKDTVAQEGMTFDCYARLDYLFDLVFEIAKRGKERVGIVRKTRLETFPEGDTFPFSYAAIAEKYGRDVLERDAVPVTLATREQVIELRELLKARADGEQLSEMWLTKAQAETLSELPFDAADKCIKYLKPAAADAA